MNAPLRSFLAFQSLVLLCLSSLASAATTEIWVGNGCDTPNLATAIASASTSAADSTTIYLVNNQPYSGLNLSILNRNITLIGGTAACGSSASDGTRTTISGAGNGGSVLLIATSGTYKTIELRKLDVRNGSGDGDGYGGGIQIGGNLAINLDNTRVFENDATFGGGISIVGDTSRPQLTLRNGSQVGFGHGLENTASTGAGIYCQNAIVSLGGAQIAFNNAETNGGGLYLDDCQLFTSGIFDADNGIQQNNAGNGAGIFALGGSSITLGISGGRTTFANNDAEEFGGAFYLSGPDTSAYVRASWLSSNTAGLFGGGVFATSGAIFTLDRGMRPELCSFFPCAAMISNRAGTSGGSAFAFVGGTIRLLGVEVLRNPGPLSAGANLHALGVDARLELNSVLVRQMDGEGILLGSGASASVIGSTFVDNTFSSDFRLAGADNVLDVQDSIIWDAPAVVVADPGNGLVIGANNNAHDDSVLPDSVVIDPGFVDADAGNYRLRVDSPNIDTRTPPAVSYNQDIEGRFRPYNLYPDNGGVFDRGAFELGNLIFADGFDPPPGP